MDDVAVFSVGDFGHAEFGFVRDQPASVVDLAAAGGVEGGAVENDGWTRGFEDGADFGVEVVEEGIVIVETVGQGLLRIGIVRGLIKCGQRRTGGSQGKPMPYAWMLPY